MEVANPDEEVGEPEEVVGVKVGKMFEVAELAVVSPDDAPPTKVVEVTWSAVVVLEDVNDDGMACVDVSEATGEAKDPCIWSRLCYTWIIKNLAVRGIGRR